MRTLKKTLSLVLVVAMVLGLCVVGASAKDKVESFTDDYQKVGAAYQEAVGVLVGVGIIDGMTETALEPQGNYTREQAAKIIAYMLLGKSKADSLKCTVAPFDDVAASRWSAGYIAFCVEQGIIDGMTATTYEPTGTLTGFQWAKMLLCAIGFGVKGEFTGSSWSVNTALVAHKVNLFAGDLDGADHTALRREQAALYAFNALKTAKVAYSPNVTSYVFGIEGYTTVNNIGTSLATDVYDLKYAQGIVVDVEGNGAGYTVVSKDYSTANVTNKIKADNDIDMMYHAARVWYTGTNTGVYTYDLAKTTTYKCQEIPTGTKAATAAKAKTDLYVGDKNDVAYEAYLLDNSAVSAGSAYVTLHARYANLGYVDAAKKTVTAGGLTVAASNVRTDISNIKYGAPIVLVYTSSTTETTASAHGMYIYPVTSTTGVIKSFAQESGKIVSVTLSDGTVLKVSSLKLAELDEILKAIEKNPMGNVYTFALDSHGHIVYATKDYARTLWAYTGEYKETTDHGTISSDRVWAHRFINVTTGEEAYYPINSTSDKLVEYGYYDISATATSAGDYVAKRVNIYDNTYAAGYVVGNWTVRNTTNSAQYTYVANPDDFSTSLGTVYIDGATVTFLVASGSGANMKVTPYTGIAAFKAAYSIATDGSLFMKNAAISVSKTSTNDWKADVIFVFENNLTGVSRYVFIPEDIDQNDWSTVTGDPAGTYATYEGAYLEGIKVSVGFYADTFNWGYNWGGFTNGKIYRGFYKLTTTYTNGTVMYWLDELVDGEDGNCFYQDVTIADSGNATTKTWYLRVNGVDTYEARDGEVVIVDVTNPNHGVSSLYQLYTYMDTAVHKGYSLAFTRNPDTGRVNYIYIIEAGWDAQVVISLSAALQNAGWKLYSVNNTPCADNTVSVTYNDKDAFALSSKSVPVVIYNANLVNVNTGTLTYPVTVGGDNIGRYAMASGKISFNVAIDEIDGLNQKTFKYEIDGLVIGDVTVTVNNEGLKMSALKKSAFEDVVLGTSLTVVVTPKEGQFEDGGKAVNPTLYRWKATYTEPWANIVNTVYGTLDSTSTYVTVTFVPVSGDRAATNGTAVLSGVDWVGYPNT